MGSYNCWANEVILFLTIRPSTCRRTKATLEGWGNAPPVRWGPLVRLGPPSSDWGLSEDESVSLAIGGTPCGQESFPLFPQNSSEAVTQCDSG